MARFVFKTSQKITLGVLIVFIGLCILLSNYYGEKKIEVFDDMNEQYYEQLVEAEVEELETGEEESSDLPVSTTTTTKAGSATDYTKYYIGYLSIPQINLKKGFTEIDNKYNNVNRNIQVLKPSEYPDIKKGNFIIAGHSGNTSVSFFKDLYKLKLEDKVTVTYKNTDYVYVIKDIYMVPKTGQVAIRRSSEKTTLTLITCTKGDKKTQTIYIAYQE